MIPQRTPYSNAFRNCLAINPRAPGILHIQSNSPLHAARSPYPTNNVIGAVDLVSQQIMIHCTVVKGMMHDDDNDVL